jgi:hypothetical protein
MGWPSTTPCSTSTRRAHHLHGHGRVDGPVPVVRRRAGQALLPAAQPHPDAPALHGRHAGPGVGHRDPGRADRLHEAAAGRAHRLSHRTESSSASRPTRTATAGSPPKRRSSTASSTQSLIVRRFVKGSSERRHAGEGPAAPVRGRAFRVSVPDPTCHAARISGTGASCCSA